MPFEKGREKKSVISKNCVGSSSCYLFSCGSDCSVRHLGCKRFITSRRDIVGAYADYPQIRDPTILTGLRKVGNRNLVGRLLLEYDVSKVDKGL